MKSIKQFINEAKELPEKDEFSKDINKLCSMLHGEIGYSDILERIDAYFSDDERTSKAHYDYFYYKEKNPNGWFYVLYSIANYDLVSIAGKKINVANSNHQNIAKLLKKLVPQKTVEEVWDRLIGDNQ